jgi:hypothetical protein
VRTIRALLLIVSGFVALTAIGGGIAMLVGADQFPLEWLAGTPFSSYTVPALILAIVVGGSSLLAFIALLTRSSWASIATLVAGVILLGYVSIEILILKQEPPGPTPTEIVYLLIGSLMAVFGALKKNWAH